MLSHRRGFSLPEILVAIAIIAALSVVAIPAVMNKLTDARAAALAQTLEGINDAVQSYRGNVGRYPRRLSQLTTKPLAGAQNGCLGTTPPVNINQWRGPYSSRTFPTTGTPIGDAMIQDTLDRQPDSSAYGISSVVVTGVERDVAYVIERSFDGISVSGTPDYIGGTVRWSVTTEPVGTLFFDIPVRGC